MFARLWFIQASTQIGGNMALYALTILVFATTRSNTAVSALVLSFLIPSILLSAAGGVLVDRLDVRVAMVVPNAIRTVLTLVLAVAGTNVAVLLAPEPRDQPDDRDPDPGRGVDDPAGRPEGAARDSDGDLQPHAPGVVRGRLRVPRARHRRGGRAVVRARRVHRRSTAAATLATSSCPPRHR